MDTRKKRCNGLNVAGYNSEVSLGHHMQGPEPLLPFESLQIDWYSFVLFLSFEL